MFDTNISYSDTNESEMILGNKIAAYGDAKGISTVSARGTMLFFIPKKEELLRLVRLSQTRRRKWLMKNITVSE